MPYTIIVLYTELMPYNVIVFKELVRKGCHIHVVHYDKNCKTPYTPPSVMGITYYKRSTFESTDHLSTLVEQINPDLIWTAGWIDSLYNKVCACVRRNKQILVIAGSDTQWRGGKQWLNVLTSQLRHHIWFSHLFVAGILQYKYASMLGFDKEHILMHNLSADVELFSSVHRDFLPGTYPKRLLYIGRFSPEKGTMQLLNTWKSFSDRKGWQLVLIGTGPLLDRMSGYPDTEIIPYMEQSELLQYVSVAGAFILPSVFEQWSLVLHEMAAAGLPLLATSCCGAVPYFVKEGENGIVFEPSESGMSAAINRLINRDETELIRMGERSRALSACITPSSVATTVLNLIADNKR